MLYMVTFTINIPQMLAYIPYMDPMGYRINPLEICDFFGDLRDLQPSHCRDHQCTGVERSHCHYQRHLREGEGQISSGREGPF